MLHNKKVSLGRILLVKIHDNWTAHLQFKGVYSRNWYAILFQLSSNFKYIEQAFIWAHKWVITIIFPWVISIYFFSINMDTLLRFFLNARDPWLPFSPPKSPFRLLAVAFRKFHSVFLSRIRYTVLFRRILSSASLAAAFLFWLRDLKAETDFGDKRTSWLGHDRHAPPERRVQGYAFLARLALPREEAWRDWSMTP